MKVEGESSSAGDRVSKAETEAAGQSPEDPAAEISREDRKLLQEKRELEARIEELEESNQLKTQLLYSMSHDIRTPLTAIMGMSEVLQEILDEPHRNIGNEIKQASQHLLDTIESVLSLARLQNSSQALSLGPVDLSNLIRELSETFAAKNKTSKKDAGIEIKSDVHHPYAMAERSALLRVLSNLLGNAQKFCPDKPVTVQLSQEDDDAVIRVIDQGPGIPQEFIDHIFKPFTRGQANDDSNPPGSGLGLCICYELLQLMEGSIDVDSEPGRGTTMTVRLPLADPPEPKEVEPDTEPLAAQSNGIRALICEDHVPTCKMLRQMLRDYEVTVVDSEASLYQNLESVDVLLLDINLQGKNRGVEIMKNLRADPKYRDLHIIAFTANTRPGQKEAFLNQGFDDYLSKPFKREELVGAVFGKPVLD